MVHNVTSDRIYRTKEPLVALVGSQLSGKVEPSMRKSPNGYLGSSVRMVLREVLF